jgi:hypothetical protein
MDLDPRTLPVLQRFVKLFGLVAFSASLCFPAIAFGAEPNLVQNGGFDTSLAGWSVNARPSWTTTWNAGTARVTWIGPETRVGYIPLSQTGIPVTAAVTYDFGASITLQPGAPQGGAVGAIAVWLYDQNLGQPLDVESATTSSAGEHAVTGRFTVPAGATHAHINLEMPGGSSQTAIYDDVFLRAASPAATFTAAPSSIGAGGTATLTWSTVNAPNVSIDQGVGTQPASGSISVSPAATTTYTLTATGALGTVTRQATVTVVPAPAVTFTVSPTSITAGQSAALSWTTANANAVEINHGIGAQPLSGSLSISPDVTTTYTLTATGIGGSTVKEVTLTVTPPRPQITFTASPRLIAEGDSATLAWTVTNATDVSIDHGVGNRPSSGSVVVTPQITTTYRLTATGPGGSASAQVTVKTLAAPVIVFTATPGTIVAGQTGTLAWTTTDATLVMIDNGIGAQQPSGTFDVRPQQTVTYVLTATGAGGVRVAQATVTVVGDGRRRAVRH